MKIYHWKTCWAKHLMKNIDFCRVFFKTLVYLGVNISHNGMHPRCFCTMRLGAGAQTDNSLEDSKYLAPPAVIMTLAARGFVLWFANLALLLYLINSLPAIHQHQKVFFCWPKNGSIILSLSMSQAVHIHFSCAGREGAREETGPRGFLRPTRAWLRVVQPGLRHE
jgi:hypothetical protein